jgi:pimeloyl-ACP methyl ester carboxylesterase
MVRNYRLSQQLGYLQWIGVALSQEVSMQTTPSTNNPAGLSQTLANALRPLDRPALVVWGKHDRYLPVQLAYRQREVFPNAEVVVLEKSGPCQHPSLTLRYERCGRDWRAGGEALTWLSPICIPLF